MCVCIYIYIYIYIYICSMFLKIDKVSRNAFCNSLSLKTIHATISF